MSPEEQPDKRMKDSFILCGQVMTFFLIFFVLIYISSSYLQRSTFENLLSFYGPDGPGMYPNVVLPKPFGVHFFGDFLLPQWQSTLKDPWIFKDFSGPPINNYLPFTMAVFWVFAQFSYWKSFLAFFGLSLIMILAPLFKAMTNFPWNARIQLLIGTVMLTGPMISLLDRGNIQLLLIGLCLFALVLWTNGRLTTSAIFLGFAIALKGYPVVLLIFFLRQRQWKAFFSSVLTAIVSTILPLLFYDGGVVGSFKSIWRNVRVNEVAYSHGYLSYNNSLKGSLLSIESLGLPILSKFASFLYAHVGLMTIMLLALVLVILLNRHVTSFEVALVSAALMCGLVDYVAPYAVGLFFIAIYFFWSEGSQVPHRWFITYGWLIAILLAPKGIPVTFWNEGFSFSSPTYTSLLGGICSVSIIILIAVRTTTRESFKEVLNLKILRKSN